ncbi:DNA double-strand break repair protein Rad50, partial ['Planchonia careya' phytoplasma]
NLIDLIPAKFGLKSIGKTVTFTLKFGQGMAKTTLILHEGHRLYHLYNEVVNENKEHLLMITKEALEMYTKDIDRDLEKLDANYKDYEKKIADYKLRQDKNNLTNEFGESRTIVKEIEQKEKSVINEYETIINELKDKQKQVLGTGNYMKKKAELEEKLENKRDNVNIFKEQLKQKNLNYARIQQLLQAK